MPISGWIRWWKSRLRPPLIMTEGWTFQSQALGREVTVDLYYPKHHRGRLVRLCICQDGQDVRQMRLPQVLQQLLQEEYPPLLFVGVHANEQRMQEYGTYAQPDYAGRGARCPAYVTFLREELVPKLENRFNISPDPLHRFTAGFSLGALPAFDLAWHFPAEFGKAGIFSGALWWRSRAFNPIEPDAHRILHDQVVAVDTVPNIQYWFQAGTEDEKEDRNNNGIIDAIDDTLQLMALLSERGLSSKEMTYLEVAGGRHEPATWAKVMPDFLSWALRENK